MLRCCRPHVHVHVYIRYRDAWKDGYTPCIRRIESPWSSCAPRRSAHSPPWRHRRGLRQEDNQNSIVLADEFQASLALKRTSRLRAPCRHPIAQFGLISINRRAVVALNVRSATAFKRKMKLQHTKCCRLQWFPVRAFEHLGRTAGELHDFPGSSSQMFQMVARNKEINGEPLRKAARAKRERWGC